MALVLLAGSLSRADEPVDSVLTLAQLLAADSPPAPPAIEIADNDPDPSPSPAGETPAPASATTSMAEQLWQDRPLGSLKASVLHTEGDRPNNAAAPRLAQAGRIDITSVDTRPWQLTNCEWDAPATRHLPLLFEEPNLERLGYTSRGSLGLFEFEEGPWTVECLQPFVSGAHFVGNIAMVPYRIGYQPACEPVYTLGHERPGSPVYYRRHQTPLSLRGALYEAGFITGMVFVIP
jgi:hypothetical protein